MLATLVERRLIVADEETDELVHESLLEHWPRLAGWLEEDAQGRRLHLHLVEAASRWDAARPRAERAVPRVLAWHLRSSGSTPPETTPV